MVSMRKMMLGAALVAGALGLGANKAQAAEFEVHMRGPAVVVPPCPGDGYAWVNGYWEGRRWFPGRWNFVGRRAPVMGYGYHRGFGNREFAPRYERFRR